MQIIKGGYSVVEFDDNASFTNPRRLSKLLKAGTSFLPKTLTEEFADNKSVAAAKAVDVSVRDANVDNAAGSAYAALKAYEEARTPLYFRFVKSLSESIVVHACDAAWQESVAADVVSAVDNEDLKEGTASIALSFSNAIAPNTILATVAVVKNLTTVKIIRLWVKSALAKSAGDLVFLIDNTANCASPLETLPLPALAAATWTEVNLVLLNPSLLGSVISIGLKAVTGAELTDAILIDNVRGVTGVVTVLNNIIPKVNFEMNESGKHNAIKVTGEGFADTEANLLTTNF
jgi:hypothetical protein